MAFSRQPQDAGWQRLFRSYLTHTCTLVPAGDEDNPNEFGEIDPGTEISGVTCFATGPTQRVLDTQRTGRKPSWSVDFMSDQDITVNTIVKNVRDRDDEQVLALARVISVNPIRSERQGVLIRSTRCEER